MTKLELISMADDLLEAPINPDGTSAADLLTDDEAALLHVKIMNALDKVAHEHVS